MSEIKVESRFAGELHSRMQTVKFRGFYFVGRFFLYVLLLGLSYVFLYPIFYMIITSLKDLHDSLDVTVRWIPSQLFYKNYIIALRVLNFKTGFINSFIITTLCTIGHLLSASFIGYGFARYKFPGRNILFGIVIFTIIVPVQVIIVPMFYEFTQVFGLLNSRIPIIAPTFLGYGLRGGLYIFLFRQFYINMPKEFEEAASIDGCGKLRTHFKIVIPIAASVCLVTVVLSMVWQWNDHFEPNVYLFTNDKQTIMAQVPAMMEDLAKIKTQVITGSSQQHLLPFPVEIIEMFKKELSVDSVLMAATTICILPIFIIYGFLQKKFIHGIEESGIKG